MTHELKNITMVNNATYFRVADDGQREVLCDVLDKDKQEIIRIFVSSNLLFDLGFLMVVHKNNVVRNFNKRISWSEKASIFLRKKYDEYLPNLGPGKNFLRKKDIWTQISYDLYNEMDMVASWKQVHNRYKSSLRNRRNRRKSDHSMPGNSIQTETIESGFQQTITIEDGIPNILPAVPGYSNDAYFLNNAYNPLDYETQLFGIDFGSNILNTMLEIRTSEEEDHEEQMKLIEDIISRLSSSGGEPFECLPVL